MKRNSSIDFVRGLVMIIMALDHVRDMFHISSLSQSPTDLSVTTVPLFFTRWITYLCAPTFVFLSGVSAFLSIQRRKDSAAGRSFVLKRGLWLILLEFTIVNFGMWFDIHFSFIILEVIAAIGLGFVVLSLLLSLKQTVILTIGLCIILFYALLPVPSGPDISISQKLLNSLFIPTVFQYGTGRIFLVGYPPIPWLGIMLIGFGMGQAFLWSEQKQRILFLKLGGLALVLFFLLRSMNLYGDPALWEKQKNLAFTVLSFVNVTKYPPSLQFDLLFLGIMFLLLAVVQGLSTRWTAFVCTYGKVPLFYFLIHWYIIHSLLFVMIRLQGFRFADMLFGSNFGRPASGSGMGLTWVYLIWMSVVLILYPLCKWYSRYKAEHKENRWLRYL